MVFLSIGLTGCGGFIGVEQNRSVESEPKWQDRASIGKKPEDRAASSAEKTPEKTTRTAGSTAKWETDFEFAKTRAKAEGKSILLDFTGSDWCGWCIRLKKEVFDKPAFKQFAAENLVLVEVDFPSGKPQSSSLKRQNEALSRQFGVNGFPTIIVLDESGRRLGKTGYLEGGPENYVRHLERIIEG